MWSSSYSVSSALAAIQLPTMCCVFIVKGVVKSTCAPPVMVRLTIEAGETTPIQLLYNQGACAGIPLAVQNAGLLVSGHVINGIDPPLINLQEQINDSVREGHRLDGECIHR
jgi:hypothetical protein